MIVYVLFHECFIHFSIYTACQIPSSHLRVEGNNPIC